MGSIDEVLTQKVFWNVEWNVAVMEAEMLECRIQYMPLIYSTDTKDRKGN